MTYNELNAAIQSYTENQFPATYLADGSSVSATTQINTFITQAEQRIYNSVQFPSLRKNVTGTTTTNNKYLSAPNDFLAVYSLAVIDATGAYEYLLNKDVNFIRQAYPKPTDTAIPKYYALFGPTTTNDATPVITDELSFILGPTPDAAYSVELHYYYYPESITVAADGRTWLGDNFDSVLLYGSLVEAYTFMKGEADMVALYNTKYQEALALAKRLGDGMERQDAYRSGQYRQAVT
jgi:CTP:phosphocholine cytidylyltransferase-like protein